MLARLKQDFYLAMLSLVGLMIILFVLPYGIYRFLNGNLVVAIADFCVVVTSLIAVWYAWRTGDTVRPGQFMAVIFCIGVGIVSINLGTLGLYWVYPLTVFIFFLVSPKQAVALSLLLLLSLVLAEALKPGHVFESQYQMMTFSVTAFVCSVFSFVFAYRTKLQHRDLQKLAGTDSLTGAGNRHTLNAELEFAVQLKKKLNCHYGLILFDLDYFKQINDNYGHKTGDQVLIRLVPLISSLLRQSDRVFRFGGEEFIVLLRDVKPKDLSALAEKIRTGVEQNLTLGDGKKVTLSAGTAMLGNDEDWEVWLHRADMALYQAKSNGRNQVVAA